VAVTRRGFLAAIPPVLCAQSSGASIDRAALVRRHNPVLKDFDLRAPLSVGNGNFVFTADVTGLQTFPERYEKQMPLCTMANWGWHENPGRPPGELKPTMFDTFGRPVPYLTAPGNQKDLYDWLRENPHKFHLGRIGFLVDKVTPIRQELDLWTGILTSEFEANGQRIKVETASHSFESLITVRITGRLPIVFEFPYASPETSGADWNAPDRHTTKEADGDIERKLDGTTYPVLIWHNGTLSRDGAHRFILTPSGARTEFTCRFGPLAATDTDPDSVELTFSDSSAHWRSFWSSGCALELPGAPEIERRAVLSQYLTAINCAGATPPAETGLTCNSWYGKFHLEMHFWHAAHFALWGRWHLLVPSLGYYNGILSAARDRAKGQGYSGARWPKMTDPSGRDSPSPIGPLLIWQQPHPIVLADLCRRVAPKSELFRGFAEMVFETADFMASYAHNGNLGPPVIPAQENHPPRETWNPTFELEYWHYGLGIAQQWRERLGLARNPRWDAVRNALAPLPVKNGVYLAHANCPQTFTERNRDHPSMLMALGVLPGAKVDRETMRRTLRKVFAEWKWADTWGWDFGMVAMTAASLGEPALAARALTMETPKNTWLANGHNWQRANLPVYLPGNGALLLALAHMAKRNAFPPEWHARWDAQGSTPLY
jgi:protein-glucosylgalactosylhydroxylysine glucosidase